MEVAGEEREGGRQKRWTRERRRERGGCQATGTGKPARTQGRDPVTPRNGTRIAGSQDGRENKLVREGGEGKKRKTGGTETSTGRRSGGCEGASHTGEAFGRAPSAVGELVAQAQKGAYRQAGQVTLGFLNVGTQVGAASAPWVPALMRGAAIDALGTIDTGRRGAGEDLRLPDSGVAKDRGYDAVKQEVMQCHADRPGRTTQPGFTLLTRGGDGGRAMPAPT